MFSLKHALFQNHAKITTLDIRPSLFTIVYMQKMYVLFKRTMVNFSRSFNARCKVLLYLFVCFVILLSLIGTSLVSSCVLVNIATYVNTIVCRLKRY